MRSLRGVRARLCISATLVAAAVASPMRSEAECHAAARSQRESSRPAPSEERRIDRWRSSLARVFLPAPCLAIADPATDSTIEPELAAPFAAPSTFVRWRVSIAAGVGITDFVDADTRDAAGAGGSWEVRLTLRTRQRLAIEASYLGSIQDIDSPRGDDDALLVSHGVGGGLRLNLLTERYQPYVVAGAAWRRFEVANDDFDALMIGDDDDVMETPIGVGFSYRFDDVILDARGSYRPVFFDRAGLDNWTASVTAGIEL